MSLKDLVVNANEIEEAALERVVRTYFKYDQTGGVLFTDRKFWKLPGDKRVILFLSALLGRKFLDLPGIETSASSGEIERQLGMNSSSVRVYISQLRRSGKVLSQNGRHTVSTQAIYELMEEKRNE